jgi:hypothetical protein
MPINHRGHSLSPREGAKQNQIRGGRSGFFVGILEREVYLDVTK